MINHKLRARDYSSPSDTKGGRSATTDYFMGRIKAWHDMTLRKRQGAQHVWIWDGKKGQNTHCDTGGAIGCDVAVEHRVDYARHVTLLQPKSDYPSIGRSNKGSIRLVWRNRNKTVDPQRKYVNGYVRYCVQRRDSPGGWPVSSEQDVFYWSGFLLIRVIWRFIIATVCWDIRLDLPTNTFYTKIFKVQ